MTIVRWLFLTAVAACVTGAQDPTPAAPAAYTATPEQSAFLDTLSRRTFDFFWETTNPRNGLTPDRWPTKSFSSVAAVGFALTAYPIGVEHGWVSRAAASSRRCASCGERRRGPRGRPSRDTRAFITIFSTWRPDFDSSTSSFPP